MVSQWIKRGGGLILLLVLLTALTGCSQENTAAKEALADSYRETYGTRVYWAGAEPDQPQVGDIRLDSLELLGEVGDTSGAVYLVTASVCAMEKEACRWLAMEPCTEVILWAETGEAAQVFTPQFLTQGMEPEQIIRQTLLDRTDTKKSR